MSILKILKRSITVIMQPLTIQFKLQNISLKKSDK